MDIFEKERRRNRTLKKYGLELNDYDDLLEKQNNCCAICNSHISKLNSPLVVDHDHKTNEVRGLLCISCNAGLGMFKDNQETLLFAIKYLQNTTGIDELTDYDSFGRPL